METSFQKRQIAYKVWIKDILDGTYVKEEGWQPNFIVTRSNKQVSRANIIGVVVFKSSDDVKYPYVVIDDGSGKITIRSFDEGFHLNNVDVGDVVLLVGRPRQYGQEKYIVPEIIKKLEEKRWSGVRKLELIKESLLSPGRKESIINEEAVTEELPQSPLEKLIALIKQMDSGNGVDVQELVAKATIEQADRIVRLLLEQGNIFEVSPGKVKVL